MKMQPHDNGTPKPQFAATIGVFDGVHQGHRHLIGCLKELAAKRNLKTMVITFARHPRQVLCPDWHPQLLTTTEEKTALLQATGVDRVEVLNFDPQMAQLSARAFMQQVLRNQLNVGLLLTGYDNRFGHRGTENAREEGFADYVAYGREVGIEVIAGQPLSKDGVVFSSTLTRRLLSEGQVGAASQCLGRHYTIGGRVVHGRQIGRKLGFPTANIEPDDGCKLLPKEGVYAVTVGIEGEGGTPLPGMMNIGRRPTFNGAGTTLEVHLLNYSGNLYDRRISVAFIHRLRDERHFDTPEALAGQMKEDKKLVEQILNNEIKEKQ